MTVTVTAGNADYAIAFSVSKTGSTGDERPDGATIYLLAQTVDKLSGNLDKWKPIAAENTVHIVTGKNDVGIKLTNCKVKADVTTTSTQEMDAIDHYVWLHGEKIGSTKVYAFVYHIATDRYKKLSHDSSGNHVSYIYGMFQKAPWKLQEGGLMYIPSLIFRQVTIG